VSNVVRVAGELQTRQLACEPLRLALVRVQVKLEEVVGREAHGQLVVEDLRAAVLLADYVPVGNRRGE
jgi:hypothetical protein